MKKKYKRAGTTSERQDYRKGGQVSKDGPRLKFFYGGAQGDGDIGLAAFDMANFNPGFTSGPAPKPIASPIAPAPIFVAQPTTGNNMPISKVFRKVKTAVKGAAGGGAPTDDGTLSPQEVERRRQQLEAQSQGGNVQVSPMQVQTLAGQVTQGELQPGTGDLGGLQTVTGTTGQVQAPEQVTTVAPAQAAQPQQVAPAQIGEVETITAQPTQAAVGSVSDKAVAEKVDVSTVPTITGVDVDIKEGALTDRVVAQMSPEAVAQAAQVNGLDVRRVTRAKEELRNAGIDEITIAELGNDPAALENRLMNLSDKDRGLVAGLPEEALVSTQMNVF